MTPDITLLCCIASASLIFVALDRLRLAVEASRSRRGQCFPIDARSTATIIASLSLAAILGLAPAILI